MAHIAVIAPPLRGHLDPLLALSAELVSRGHRLTFLVIQDAVPRLDGHGIGHEVIGRRSHPPGSLRRIEARLGAASGLLGLPGVLDEMVLATRAVVEDGPAACRRLGIDLILGDQTEAGAGLLARRLGLPHVSVASALPLNREPSVPPPFTGWRFDESRWGIERNLGGYRVSDALMRRHSRVIADCAAAWKLGALRRVEDCLSPSAEISQLVAGLDFPRRALPGTFHYVGPLRRPTGDPTPAAPGLERPYVFASLGSLQGGRLGLLRTIAEAVRRAGLRLILAHGGRLSAEEAAGLPGDTVAHAFVPQRDILSGARAAILHGGLNTVLDALSARTPIIVLPIAFEQGAIARRVERAGAGRMLGRRFLRPGTLARAVREVIDRPSYRDAAERLSAEIAAAGGVGRASDIVEAVLATGRPMTRLSEPSGLVS